MGGRGGLGVSVGGVGAGVGTGTGAGTVAGAGVVRDTSIPFNQHNEFSPAGMHAGKYEYVHTFTMTVLKCCACVGLRENSFASAFFHLYVCMCVCVCVCVCEYVCVCVNSLASTLSSLITAHRSTTFKFLTNYIPSFLILILLFISVSILVFIDILNQYYYSYFYQLQRPVPVIPALLCPSNIGE